MAPEIVRYPFDPLGKNRNNLVPGEMHRLGTNERRIIVPLHGAFYTESIILVDVYTNKPLKHNVHYVFDSLRQEVTALTGKEICGIIVVIDRDVSDQIALTYQAVGGPYTNNMEDILNYLPFLAEDTRTLQWKNVRNKPSEFKPVHHPHDIGDAFNFDNVAHAVERLRMLDDITNRVEADITYAVIEQDLAKLAGDGSAAMADLLAQHKAKPDPHEIYVLKTEMEKYVQRIRKPINAIPSIGQTNVPLDVTLVGGNYYSLYRSPGAAAPSANTAYFQISASPDFSGELVVNISQPWAGGTSATYRYNGILESNKLYYWRHRYTSSLGEDSGWSNPTSFTTMAVSVTQPYVASPTNGSDTNREDPILTASAFSMIGAADTHVASDWEVWTGPNGTGTKAWGVTASTSLTSIGMPLGVLTRNTVYYPRVRYKSSKYGYSAWSTGASFNAVWPLRPTVIGQSFGGGFWGGDIVVGPDTFAIIVAPKATGEASKKLVGNLVNTPGSASTHDSITNTTSLAALTGTSASAAAAFVKGLNISTYTDWQIPSREALRIVRTNLNPAGASTPANFKAGGSEAFASTNYWSSTTYDWIDSGYYTIPGDPIYGTVTTTTDKPRSFSYGPTGESVDYSGYVKCSASEIGPSDVDGPNFSPGSGSINGDRIGYWSASWVCTVVTTRTEIIGYEPDEEVYYSDPKYQAYILNMGSTSAPSAVNKTGTYNVRAVRLVKVA